MANPLARVASVRFFGHRSRDYTFDKSSSDDDQSHNRDNAVLQATLGEAFKDGGMPIFYQSGTFEPGRK